jgi:hypothetical protein
VGDDNINISIINGRINNGNTAAETILSWDGLHHSVIVVFVGIVVC